MVDPTEMPDLQDRMDRLRSQSGGGDGSSGDMGYRIGALETSVEKMGAKLDRLLEGVGELRAGLARVEERLDGKASSAEVAGIKGRVDSLPTTWQMITLVVGTVFAILGGSFLILKFGLPHAP